MSTWEKFHVNISIHTYRKSCNVQLPKNDSYQNYSAIMCCCITVVSLLICIIYVTCIIKMLICFVYPWYSISTRNVISVYTIYLSIPSEMFIHSKICAFLWLHYVPHLHNLCKLHNLFIFNFVYSLWVRGKNFMSISSSKLPKIHIMCNYLKISTFSWLFGTWAVNSLQLLMTWGIRLYSALWPWKG